MCFNKTLLTKYRQGLWSAKFCLPYGISLQVSPSPQRERKLSPDTCLLFNSVSISYIVSVVTWSHTPPSSHGPLLNIWSISTPTPVSIGLSGELVTRRWLEASPNRSCSVSDFFFYNKVSCFESEMSSTGSRVEYLVPSLESCFQRVWKLQDMRFSWRNEVTWGPGLEIVFVSVCLTLSSSLSLCSLSFKK